jgi:hypothetical protein
MSDIEGKAARVAAMECGQRQSFKSRDRLCRLDCARTQANKDNAVDLCKAKRPTARAVNATTIRIEPKLWEGATRFTRPKRIAAIAPTSTGRAYGKA